MTDEEERKDMGPNTDPRSPLDDANVGPPIQGESSEPEEATDNFDRRDEDGIEEAGGGYATGGIFQGDEDLLFEDDDEIRARGAGHTSPVNEGARAPIGCCHPNSRTQMGLALVLMCSLGFGSYFCYDNPGALQKQITTVMNVTTLEFENLYSFYSWPNVILPILGGHLIDRILGLPLSAVVFSVLLMIGQALTMLGALTYHYWLMELGRFVFGLGGESLAVAQNTYASTWFKGNALNMVFGLQLSVSRVGSTVNFQVLSRIFAWALETYNDGHKALGFTLGISGFSLVLSLMAAVIIGMMEVRRERMLRATVEDQPEVHLKDIARFPAIFWLVTVVCVAYYVAIFPFVTLGQVFFEEKFHFSEHDANFINGLIYLMSAFGAPLFGFIIDRIGRNLSFVLLSCLVTILGHGLIAFTMLTPYVGVSLIGIGYSLLAASLWPIIALIIPLHRQGTAYGFTQAIQNLGLGVVALLSGWIVDEAGYLWLEVFFIGCLGLATAAVVLMWILDRKESNYLSMNVARRKEFETTSQYRRLLGLGEKDD